MYLLLLSPQTSVPNLVHTPYTMTEIGCIHLKSSCPVKRDRKCKIRFRHFLGNILQIPVCRFDKASEKQMKFQGIPLVRMGGGTPINLNQFTDRGPSIPYKGIPSNFAYFSEFLSKYCEKKADSIGFYCIIPRQLN